MMLPPVPSSYIWRSAARVVRNAPSRWIASICFHLANSNWSRGATIWIPALLTRMSSRPNAAIALAMPASTCGSLLTSIATPTARLPDASSSFAAALAPCWFRSAMTILAPSLAKVRAISLPMPLAAPVTTATLSSRRIGLLLAANRRLRLRREIVMHHLAEAEREIAQNMDGRDDLQHGQFGHRRQGMRGERQGARPDPRALDRDVLEAILDQLADARAAVDMRDDLQQEIRRGERRLGRRKIGLFVLVSHRRGRDPHRTIIQGADQHVDLRAQAGIGQLLRKAPQLAPARDRRLVVQEHAVGVAAPLAPERHGDHLAGFRVVAEAGRVRHADELILDQRLGDLERLGHDGAQPLGIGPVGDDQKLAVDESIRPAREGWTGKRHREGVRENVGFFHEALLFR